MSLETASGVVPTSGWYVEIDIEQSGDNRRTVTPEILEDASWTPAVNQLPEVSLSVAPQPYFVDGRADSAPCRVWLDGVRLPIEEVTAVERQRGNRQDTLALRAIGGVELERRVQRTYQNIPAVDAVESLITAETDLVANVDNPTTSGFGKNTNENILLTVDTSSGFKNSLTSAVDSISNIDDNTSPLTVSDVNDDIRRQRTSFLWAAGNPDGAIRGGQLAAKDGATRKSASGASHSEVIEVEGDGTVSGPIAETDTKFTTEYKIPDSADIVVAARVRQVNTGQSDVVLSYTALPPNSTGESLARGLSVTNSDFHWITATFDTDPVPVSSEIIGQVEAFGSSGPVEVDAIAVYDSRVNHTTELSGSDLDDNNNLRGPAPYGPLDGEDGSVTDAIRGETANDQLSQSTLSGSRTTLSLSTDVENIEVSATAAGVTARERSVTDATVKPGELTDRASGGFALTGAGTQNASPSEGIFSHELESFEIRGLVTGEERLIGRSFDDDLVNVLGTIADDTNSIWEVTVDGSGSLAIEWSKPGLRSTQDTLPASAIEYQRETQTINAATVVGGAVEFEEEIDAPAPGGSERDNDAVTVTARSYSPSGIASNDVDAQAVSVSSGTVQLSNDRIIAGAERVVSATTPTVRYQQIQDYEIDYLDGALIVPSGSDINEGETLLVEYEYHPTGEFVSDTWDGDARTDRSVTIPTVKTEGAAEQAARQLVRQTADSRVEATVDLSDLDPDTSVVSALGIEELSDLSDSWRVQSYERRPQSPKLRLSTGRPVSEFVAELTRQFKTLRSRV